MSTTGIESWAVDLKDVGAIYPFQGSEGLLVIIGVVTWIGWHIWQSRWEKENMRTKSKTMVTLQILKRRWKKIDDRLQQ